MTTSLRPTCTWRCEEASSKDVHEVGIPLGVALVRTKTAAGRVSENVSIEWDILSVG